VKLPRDISGKDLIKALSRLDYEVTRQTGSHVRLTTQRNGEHHITVPAHDPIKILLSRFNSR
jgi:predicted RNA binding protein YcfA (HicA-like mRNA interferase family)